MPDDDIALKLGCGAALVPIIPLFILAVSLPRDMLYGYVLWREWTWFAIPAGAPEITYPHAVGLLLLGKVFKYPSAVTATKKEDRKWVDIVGALIGNWILGPAMLLGVGWAIHTYWMPHVG